MKSLAVSHVQQVQLVIYLISTAANARKESEASRNSQNSIKISYICDRAWEKGPCRANNDFSV